MRLSAEAFVEVEAKRGALTAGHIESAELGDLQQRSYRIEVAPSGHIGVEAIGRSLRDLRLWRDDGELVDIGLETGNVEQNPGRLMTRLRIDGSVAPEPTSSRLMAAKSLPGRTGMQRSRFG